MLLKTLTFFAACGNIKRSSGKSPETANEKRIVQNGRGNADMAELADAPALGAGVFDVGVRLPLSAPKKEAFRGFFFW